jgi:SAM-dependent methyltransferase
VGEDALSGARNLKPGASTSKWDAAEYARVGSFVPELGMAALDLLDPRPGERILDVGCGDGALTRKIVERGASVVGVDNSPEMVAAAVAAGLDARLCDAAAMAFDAEFDGAFCNASLHWMLDKHGVAAAVFRALKPGGRFAGEFGGKGNIARLRGALDAELVGRGYAPPLESANWYATPEEFADVYGAAGFTGIDARLIDRPTPLEHGVAAWILTFRAGWLERAGVPKAEWGNLAAAVAARVGTPEADYVRLRFIMRKPA